MIEVFKTDVTESSHARFLVTRIGEAFTGCEANFDLQDCDHILRVQSAAPIPPVLMMDLLRLSGFRAEVLPD